MTETGVRRGVGSSEARIRVSTIAMMAYLGSEPPTLYCPTCRYNLTGLIEQRCPECGKSFDRRALLREARIPRTSAWPGIRILLVAPTLTVVFSVASYFTPGVTRSVVPDFLCCIALIVLAASGMFAKRVQVYKKDKGQTVDLNGFGTGLLSFVFATLVQVALVAVAAGIVSLGDSILRQFL